jgi:hypothetical protein
MASKSGTTCNRCGAPAEGPGAVTIRFIDDQGLEQLARVELCPWCAQDLGIWLRPGEPPETEAAPGPDDQVE